MIRLVKTLKTQQVHVIQSDQNLCNITSEAMFSQHGSDCQYVHDSLSLHWPGHFISFTVLWFLFIIHVWLQKKVCSYCFILRLIPVVTLSCSFFGCHWNIYKKYTIKSQKKIIINKNKKKKISVLILLSSSLIICQKGF